MKRLVPERVRCPGVGVELRGRGRGRPGGRDGTSRGVSLRATSLAEGRTGGWRSWCTPSTSAGSGSSAEVSVKWRSGRSAPATCRGVRRSRECDREVWNPPEVRRPPYSTASHPPASFPFAASVRSSLVRGVGLPTKCREKFVAELVRRRLSPGASNDDDEVEATRKTPFVSPEDLANPAFPPVSNRRRSHLGRGGNAEATESTAIRPRVDDEMITGRAIPPLARREKLSSLEEPLRFAQPLIVPIRVRLRCHELSLPGRVGVVASGFAAGGISVFDGERGRRPGGDPSCGAV